VQIPRRRLRQRALQRTLAAAAGLSEHDVNNLMHLLRSADTALWPAATSNAFKKNPAEVYVTTPQHVGHLLLALILRGEYQRTDLPNAVKLYGDLPPSYSVPIDRRTGRVGKRREAPEEWRGKPLRGWLGALLTYPIKCEKLVVWQTSPRVELHMPGDTVVFHAAPHAPDLAAAWAEMSGRQAAAEAEAEHGFPRMTVVPPSTLAALRETFETVPEAAESAADREAAEVSEELVKLAA
jgi:hypothetical protein